MTVLLAFPDDDPDALPDKVGKTWHSKRSEFAQGIAALVPALPEVTAQDLMRLVSHSLAAPSSSEMREARLGLVLDLVADGTGEFIAVDRYEAERAMRRSAGEVWPGHATLIDAYGDWPRVVSLAMLLHRDGTASGVPYTRRHLRERRSPYRREDVIDALTRCASDIGDWPGEWEYHEWARISRMLARDAGKSTNRRFPGRGPIKRLFGDFGRALQVARRATESRGESA